MTSQNVSLFGSISILSWKLCSNDWKPKKKKKKRKRKQSLETLLLTTKISFGKLSPPLCGKDWLPAVNWRCWLVGRSKNIKMADPEIQRSTFIVKHYDTIDFSINQKTTVQESLKVSVFSCQDKTYVPNRDLSPGL